MYRLTLALFILLFGCNQPTQAPMPDAPKPATQTVDEIFQGELIRRGLTFTIADEGHYRIDMGDEIYNVSLENIRRTYERDRDRKAVEQFAQQFDDTVFEDSTWAEAKSFVRYSLEPSDYEEGLKEAIHDSLTPALVKVYVIVNRDGSRIRWIMDSMLKEWNITRDELASQAEQNMAQIVRETTLDFHEVKGVKLGLLETEEICFKASMILSPQFRELVSPTHGWPVLVTVPARDFVYVLSRDNVDFLGNLGGVVLEEFSGSAYSITPEVLEVSDKGIKAIGSFAPPEEQSDK